MTREEAGRLWTIIKAYAEGKQIEFKDLYNGKWYVAKNPNFTNEVNTYRIKQEPTYRPFKNASECWEEMKKHEPFGWIIKQPTISVMIDCVCENSIRVDGSLMCFSNAFVLGYTFADGTPFGKKEE